MKKLKYSMAIACGLLHCTSIFTAQEGVKLPFEVVHRFSELAKKNNSLDVLLQTDPNLKRIFDEHYVELCYRSINRELMGWVKIELFNYIIMHKPDVVRLLEQKHPDILHQVLWFNQDPMNISVLKTLIDHGCNIEGHGGFEDRYSVYHAETPFLTACRYRSSMSSLLLGRGANIDATDDKNRNGLQIIQEKIQKDEYHLVELFLIKNQIKNYYVSRKENRIFQQCLNQKPGMTKAVMELISEYTIASHPVKTPIDAKLRPYIFAPHLLEKKHRAALESVKLALQRKDKEPLKEFLQSDPRQLSITDGADETVLFAAYKSKDQEAINLVERRLAQLDALEKGINKRVEKVHAHKNGYGKTVGEMHCALKNTNNSS